MFFGCVNEEIQQAILEVIGFVKGKLSVRYLGVPLSSKTLGLMECKCLINKVKSRISDWRNKCLSNVGDSFSVIINSIILDKCI